MQARLNLFPSESAKLAHLKEAYDAEQGPMVERRLQVVGMLYNQQQPASFLSMQSPFAVASAAMTAVADACREGQFLQAAQQIEELQLCIKAEHEAWARFQQEVAQVGRRRFCCATAMVAVVNVRMTKATAS